MSPIVSRVGFNRGFGLRRGLTQPTYSVSASTTSVNEGSSVVFTITTTNVPDGTTLYWTTNTISGTVNTSDFNDSVVNGFFSITNNSGTVTRTLSNDTTTEGSESFQLQIRTESISGPIVATSQTVTINDTSITQPFSATGGNVSALAPGNGYRYHTFTSPGTFTVSGSPGTLEVLVVAGGGAGGGGRAGGGGAGGLIYQASFPITVGSYPITIGSGGTGLTPSPVQPTRQVGSSGGNSTFSTLTAIGGGGGGSCCDGGGIGAPGGSGGGGGGFAAGQFRSGGTGTPGQGNAGGAADGNSPYGAGGGGGAGGAGRNGLPGAPGGGGVGLQYPQFTGTLIGVPALSPLNGFFAGGGAGDQSGGATSPGGAGGGGNVDSAGITNSGGGGGGSNASNPLNQSGGSGIVVIRYLA